jgi:hypothetical protein
VKQAKEQGCIAGVEDIAYNGLFTGRGLQRPVLMKNGGASWTKLKKNKGRRR